MGQANKQTKTYLGGDFVRSLRRKANSLSLHPFHSLLRIRWGRNQGRQTSGEVSWRLGEGSSAGLCDIGKSFSLSQEGEVIGLNVTLHPG